MNRRRPLLFTALSLGAVVVIVAVPPAACAADSQQRAVRVGFVGPNSPSTDPRALTPFRDRLRELGWIEGQNLVIEARWAEGQADRLPALAAEVIERKVDVIVTYSTPAAIAVKNATGTIPIVVAAMGDPVGTGLVSSLGRPGGNLTGLSLGWGGGIGGKLLELLQETVPRLTTAAVLTNPDNPVDQQMTAEVEAAAPVRRLKLRIIGVRKPEQLDSAFELTRRQAQAVVVIPGYLFLAQRQRITALAAQHRLPAVYGMREYTEAGGLMAYGPDRAVMFRRAAEYVDKILRGAKPRDLPIEQPTEYSLTVNLKTAKALGLTIPESILVRAEEVNQ
jgi:putative ABC transport system substrate-binding protein